MSALAWFACGLALGVALGYAVGIVQQQFRSDAQEVAREERRRLMGLESRAARRPTAVGTPRVVMANFKRNMPKQ